MKILVYGSKGWIGQQFINIIEEKSIEFFPGRARVDNTKKMQEEIEQIQPTHIVSFIGRTHGNIDGKVYATIDYLEQPDKLQENVRDNLFSPLSLALICKEKNIHYTYLGTGCIFSYVDGRTVGFTEDEEPNFFGSSYSTVKGYTDRFMHQFPDNVLNLRIRMPIIGEDNLRNFITKITNYAKICSIPNSMTVLPELLPIVLDMMIKEETGTINLTNPGVINHNEILEMYRELVKPEFTWVNFTIEEQAKILDSKRSNNFLDTTTLEKLYPKVRPIKEAVREILKNYISHTELQKKQDITDFPDSKDTCLFITGGCGFIGSNFINEIWQQYRNIRIINFDALYYCANVENINRNIRNNARYNFIHGNLQSFDLLKYIFQSNKITHIIHFAAQSHVQSSFTDSLQYTQDNIVGTHNLLEACRLYAKVDKFIHVSTDEVYGESMLDVDEKHKTEQSILCPTNPYAATKAAAELLAQSYHHSFKLPIIITRGNNVYGPNQYPEKVIPRFIKQLKEGKPVTIQGDGSCIRAFLHAYDTATAFQTILEKGEIGEIYNIGCDKGMEYSILDVAKILIKKICGENANYEDFIEYIEDRPFNDKRYYISNQKLKDLGWRIQMSFEKGIYSLSNV